MKFHLIAAALAVSIFALPAFSQDEAYTIVKSKDGKLYKGIILEESEQEITIRTWTGDKKIRRDNISDMDRDLSLKERQEIIRGLNPTADAKARRERDKQFANANEKVDTPLVKKLPSVRKPAIQASTPRTASRRTRSAPLVSSNAGSWEKQMYVALHKRVSLEFVDERLTDALNLIRTLTDLNIIVDPKVLEAQPTVSLNVKEMDVATTLKWLSKLTNTYIDLRDQAIYFTDQKPKAAEDEERMEMLSMMLRAGVDKDLLPPEGTPITNEDRVKIAMAIWKKTNPKPTDFPGPSFGIQDENSNQNLVNPFAGE